MGYRWYPKDTLKREKCNGEAHRNPFIDHCEVCAPNWKYIFYCPLCNNKVEYNPAYTHMVCRTCRLAFK